MDFQNSLKINSSGLSAHRAWMNVVSANLANAHNTRADNGKAYQRRTLIYESVPVPSQFDTDLEEAMSDPEADLQRVRVVEIVPDKRQFRQVYDPNHPDANENGIVEMPNINPVEEMANLLIATRSFEANLAALNTTKQMAMKAIEIGR